MKTTLLDIEISYEIREQKTDRYTKSIGKDISGADIIVGAKEGDDGVKKETVTSFYVDVTIGTDNEGDPIIYSTQIPSEEYAEQAVHNVVLQNVPSISARYQEKMREEEEQRLKQLEEERKKRIEEMEKQKEQETQVILAMQSILRYFQDNEDEKYGRIMENYREEYDEQNGKDGDSEIGIILAKALEMTGVLDGYTAGNGSQIFENIDEAKDAYQEQSERIV